MKEAIILCARKTHIDIELSIVPMIVTCIVVVHII